jgi:DNA-binding NtrC family response regulator
MPNIASATDSAERTRTILVVEDDTAVRRSLWRLLTRAGFEVFEAVDGEDALRIWQEQRARIDLVLSDLMMPEMNGGVLAQSIHAISPETKFLFLSGYAAESVMELLRDDALVLEKPIDSAALIQTINNLLNPGKRATLANE